VAEARSLFDREILRQALIDSITKLNPAVQIRNPVMFVVLVGSIVTFIEAIAHPGKFTWFITIWLFLTVIFANFAEAMAEGRGKAQADTLRKMRSETEARRLNADGRPTTSSPPMVRSSRASPRSTNRPLPASRPRSSANREATVRPSPAAPRSCPTGLWSASRRSAATPSSIA
jgi:ABC-type multidrug transport system fused ATPase/permease subunit